MARDKGKLGDILTAVVARLIDQVSGYNAANCYLSIDPDSVPEPGVGEFTIVVSPASEQFQGPYFEGGGEQQATTQEGIIIVKIHSPVQLDEPHRDTIWLTDTTLGICEKMRLVMKALSNWSPGTSGNELTRDPFSPGGYVFTRRDRGLAGVEMTFRFMFDWDLT